MGTRRLDGKRWLESGLTSSESTGIVRGLGS